MKDNRTLEFKCRKFSLAKIKQDEFCLIYYDEETKVRAELKACIHRIEPILSILTRLYKGKIITKAEYKKASELLKCDAA